MMPGPEFYKGMTVAESLRALAEHHVHEETRHISGVEYELLHRAATRLQEYETDGADRVDDVDRLT
jgi:hypothetical protein